MSKRGMKPETIAVSLPSPFTGNAFYSSGGPSAPPGWTGDLSVDLPGLDRVPLTGPGFQAAFCRGRVGACP